MPPRPFFTRVFTILATLSLLLGATFTGGTPIAYATLGWVGGMFPAGGSSTTITAGGAFTVYVQVYKAGVTEPAGQGANISCTLHWAAVPYFGGTWSNVTDTAMTFNTQVGNNDEYKATINPGVGLYEFTAFCTDTTDSTTLWQTGGNGKLVADVASGACNAAAQGDNTVYYNGLLHDSFSSTYRNPGGPVPTTQGTVTLKFRTCMDDVNAIPTIRIWDDRNDTETIAALTFDSHSSDATLGGVTYWAYTVAVPASANIFYYVFKATDGATSAFYRDDDPKFYGGGYGAGEANQTTAYNNSYQLTIYDPAYSVPAWMQRGIVYQIFPDRFRNGNTGNDPAAGRFSYNTPGGAIVRSNQSDWNYTVCDPRNTYTPSCDGKYGDNFYGGDLAGITQKINDGYFDNLGVTVLYLNPIFRSPSNHKYDTADYMVIDPDFGTLADFQSLVAAANTHGIKIMLDGVFNHVSSDSKYFDRYFRYDAAGNLTSPGGIGADDNSGACEAAASSFYSWFYFPDIGNPGKDGAATVYCNNDSPQSYEAWYGYSSLPKLQANSTAVRNLIWNNGLSSVGPYWTQQGAWGWRFDVGADVDCGLTCVPSNDYWEGFRAAVRNVGVTGKSDVVMLGEEWGDASGWLLGNEWDSVMNYRYRSAVMSWLFTGCSGNGCNGGTSFDDNDSNGGSSSGSIAYLSPSQFNARLRAIAEDYPPMAFKAMMNLEGSHDTNRIRFLLKKANNDNDSAAQQRMKEMWIFAFTYAGAPTLYYGDEIGLNHDGVFSGGKYEDDPYNRAPFPWPDASGSSYTPLTDLQGFARHMASVRLSYRALQDGDVQHGLIIDDANKLYGFARTNGSQTALIALNRDGAAHTATFTGLNASPYNLPDGTVLVDALNGGTYTVSGGSVSVTVNPTWGVVLLEQNKIETPATITNLNVTVPGNDVLLKWNPIITDTTGGRELATAYEIHRSTTSSFTPGAGTLIATVTPSNYGNVNNQQTYTNTGAANTAYYYIVLAKNAAGKVSAAHTSVPSWLSVTVNVVASEDGYALESTETSGVGGSANSTATTFRMGDDASDRQYRGILSFDTGTPLPDTATVRSAEVRIQRASVTGTSPFSTHGTLWVDIITGAYSGNNAVQTADFQAASTATQVASLSNATSNGQWSSGFLNSTGNAAVNKTGRTQLKLRFNLDDNDDLGADYISYNSGNHATSTSRPVLVIYYTLP